MYWSALDNTCSGKDTPSHHPAFSPWILETTNIQCLCLSMVELFQSMLNKHGRFVYLFHLSEPYCLFSHGSMVVGFFLCSWNVTNFTIATIIFDDVFEISWSDNYTRLWFGLLLSRVLHERTHLMACRALILCISAADTVMCSPSFPFTFSFLSLYQLGQRSMSTRWDLWIGFFSNWINLPVGYDQSPTIGKIRLFLSSGDVFCSN